MNSGLRFDFRKEFDSGERIQADIEFDIHAWTEAADILLRFSDKGRDHGPDTGPETRIVGDVRTLFLLETAILFLSFNLEAFQFSGDRSWKWLVTNGQ